MFTGIIENVRKNAPLIHNITNYVTVNDCANILLACGASPIMADAVEEAEEITKICSALNINIGTLNANTVSAMLASGIKSNYLGHPVILDPVGAGASAFRTNTAKNLIENIKFTVIKGNISEIKTLAKGKGNTSGVDASNEDMVDENNIDEVISLAKAFSKFTGAVIAITGKIDIVADKNNAFCIYNGNKMMSSVTGTGCQLSAMTAAFVAANQQNPLKATAAAVCTMGLCGEKAYMRMQQDDGNITYRNYIIDAVYNMTSKELKSGAKYEMR